MPKKKINAWAWIPSLYFAEGLPYVAVMTVSVILYKNLGISNTDIALYTSWLYLPWVIKPFWSPIVDLFRTKRWWIWTMQLVVGAALGGVALTLPGEDYFRWSLCFFWLVAFSSATHDIAADGFYMLALDDRKQAFFVGIRSTFYRFATIAGQGILVIIAGQLQKAEVAATVSRFVFWREWTGDVRWAWEITFLILAVMFIVFGIYHLFALPHAELSKGAAKAKESPLQVFASFFRKRHIMPALLFMLLYRFPEAQLVKLIQPFLLDPADKGGLGLTTSDVGIAYGTVGIAGLTVGGIVGGWAASRGGLRRWLMPMAWSISLTCLTFLYLAIYPTSNLWIVSVCVCIEQLGYGFGFTAYMLYLMHFAKGERQTAHYALCTGFMALGMMLPGMFAGWLEDLMGYRLFFAWVMLCCVVTISVSLYINKLLRHEQE